MELMDAIFARRSVRGYAPTPVDRAAIERILNAAAQAPSGMNLQPRAFGVLQGVEAIRGYGTRAREHLLSVLHQIPVLERYREVLSNPAYDLFYGAPAAVIIYGTPGGGTTETDCCLAAENLMLAACDQGLGTCWIGFAQAFFDLPETKAELGVPVDYRVIAPIAVGYPANPVAPRPANTPNIVFWR